MLTLISGLSRDQHLQLAFQVWFEMLAPLPYRLEQPRNFRLQNGLAHQK